jgi:DEAD/DEAH box helicase domain-containing protein
LNKRVQQNIVGIVFCNSIHAVNALTLYIKESKRFSSFSNKIRAYYASMSTNLKNKTLMQLKSKEINIIICTNALEVGIDISDIDACLLKGIYFYIN